MACLNEARIQAVADGEGTAAEVDHVQWCSACRERVQETERDARAFAHGMASIAVPPMSLPRRGATTLRPEAIAVRPRPAWIVAGAAAAAIILALFVVFPSIDSRTRLNASEILNRSLATLEGSGIELLKYHLAIDAPRLAPGESGEFLIEQLIDHDTGRWRFARFTAAGSLLSGIAEDPGAARRDVLIRDADRSYRFTFQLAAGDAMPLGDLQRRYAEALIRVVQAAGARADLITSANGEQQYVVELPDAAAGSGSPIFDLHRARVVIDRHDFHIIEFSAAGSVVGDSVTVGYRLIERSVWGSQPSEVSFELPQDSNAVELRGEATRHVPYDIVTLLLRAVRP